MAMSIPYSRRPLTAGAALRQAWYWYLALAFVPFIAAMGVITALNYHDGSPRSPHVREAWLIAAIAIPCLIGPAAFYFRSRMFRPYWRGESVPPRDYLTGMLAVWIAFMLSGLIALAGCVGSNSLLPCFLPALADFVFFVTLWPNGHAMARPTGNSDDPEIYKEPR